ncbi:MAG: phosphotransferase, partial [Holophaga sp.]|nr:phosphotransferase [Holophaga sp.]
MNALRILPKICAAFRIPGHYICGEPYGSGHINGTYAVTVDQAGQRIRYLFQCLNTSIFKDAAGLMANVENVTRHIRRKLESTGAKDVSRRVLTLMQTHEGACYLDDAELGFWRVYLFIEGGRTYDLLETPDQAYFAAKAFGNFQRLLADYTGPRLTETIPFFHDTVRRLETFRQAIASDPLGRVAVAGPEIEFALSRETLAHCLLDLQASGDIPERITHNDTKLNNVMLD